MKRNTYLQEFKNGLFLFEESYQQSQVLALDEKINSMIDSGKSEEEALKELGDVTLLVQTILKENHIDRMALENKKNSFHKALEQLFQVIRHVIDVMSQNSMKANGKIVFDFLILILLTCLLKIPFLLVQDLVGSFLGILAIPWITNLWQLFIELIYLIVAIVFFFSVFQKWFQNLKIEK